MSFTDAVKSVFSHYADFSGRARRSEYWYFALFTAIVEIILGTISAKLGMNILTYIWSLAVFVPNLAVAVRRLHDIGKSGICLLFGLIPIVGPILLLIWNLRDSMPEANQYGPNPKYTY